MNLIEQIKESGIVAVIRGANEENILPIAKSLLKGGVKTLEITAETKGVLRIIEKVAAEYGDQLIIGAGTVLDPETARAAIMAGAKFIFSPTVNIETIKMAKRYGVISIPGALTPTEILTAYENGADIIKVFPANAFGPSYLKSIRGPLPHIPMMPTGGVDLTNIEEYIKAGGVAAGIGSNLVNPKKLVTEEDYKQLEQTAAQYVEKVQAARK